MVSTLDSESSDPSSNLGGTLTFFNSSSEILSIKEQESQQARRTSRDSSVGRALD